MLISSRFKRKEIFFSYDSFSKRDKSLLQELFIHLAPLKNEYSNLRWGDSGKIEVGNDINRSREGDLNAADIIVLLLSPDYLASQSCQLEMQRTLTRHITENVRMIPVVLRPIDKKNSPLAPYYVLPSNGVSVIRWSNRDEAFLEVAAAIRLAVEKLVAPTVVYSQMTFVPNTSQSDNAFFTDRDPVLDKISTSFASTHHYGTPILALNGPPGIGKTQIARAYRFRSSQVYRDILWLNASSLALLSKDVGTYVAQNSLSEEDDENEKRLFSAFQRWLQNQSGWLLVLDHLEDIALVDLIVPDQSSGHVLLTTRKQATGRHTTPITIISMDDDAGALFLLRRAKIIGPLDPLEQAPPTTVSKAEAISQALKGFPLALEQAGAYIEATGCSLATYRKFYDERRAWVLSKHGQVTDDQHQSVMGTFDLVFQEVSQKSPASLDLLRLLAFLHPDAIFEELLTNGAPILSNVLRSLVADPEKLHQHFAVLLNFSLIYWSPDRILLQMQRIVQDVLIEKLPINEQHHLARLAVRLVNYVFPEVTFATRDDCLQYLPHAQHCAALITKYELRLKAGALLLERLGSFCARRASYEDAEKYLRQALHLYKGHLSEHSLDHAQVLNALGLLYHQQARYKEAEVHHQCALKLRERLLGQDDTKTTESWHNLAMVYGDLGKYQEAEVLFLRVLALEERKKGPDHPHVADTLNELGLTYTQQGRFAEAKTAYQRAFTIYEHSRDANHPDLTYALDGLGALAEQQGDYQQAKNLYQQAFAICEQAFGERHPETAHSRNRLAGIAVLQNDYEEAERLYQQALSIYEQKLGQAHPHVALVLNDWGLLATKQRQYQKAQEFYERALHLYKNVLGSEHPDVASVLNNLGQLFYETGDQEQAKKLWLLSLAIREKAFDLTHPSIAQSRNNVARLQNDE